MGFLVGFILFYVLANVASSYKLTDIDSHLISSKTETEFFRRLRSSGDPSSDKAYYKKRILQALSCTKNEHLQIEDDSGCQLCTCDGEGAMLCKNFDCSQSNGRLVQDIKDEQKEIVNKVVDGNLVLREYATGCKAGTTVQTAMCTCSCVLSSVLSCPKSCFDIATEGYTTTEETTTEEKYTSQETTYETAIEPTSEKTEEMRKTQSPIEPTTRKTTTEEMRTRKSTIEPTTRKTTTGEMRTTESTIEPTTRKTTTSL